MLGVVLLALTVIYMLVLGLVDATLKGILLGALYLYATAGEVPTEFDRGVMNGIVHAEDVAASNGDADIREDAAGPRGVLGR